MASLEASVGDGRQITPPRRVSHFSVERQLDFVQGDDLKHPHLHVVSVPVKDEHKRSWYECLQVTGTCLTRPCSKQFSWRSFFVNNFTYFRLHFSYFVLMSLVGGGIIYGIENHWGMRATYIDCLFTAVSACCVTGLATQDISKLHVGSQVVLWVLVMAGSNILMSIVPVIIRRRYFVQSAVSKFDDEQTRKAALESQAEYQALGWVIFIAFSYFVACFVVVGVTWGIYFSSASNARTILDQAGVNPWWFAVFLTTNSLNNAGFSLLNDNLAQFSSDYVVLLLCSGLILLGNIAYPVVFRLIVYALHHCKSRDESLKFLMDTPRRCYTHMFPATNTRILAAAVAFFTLLQFVMFMALDYDLAYLEAYSGHERALMMYFQSVSTRTAGFGVLDLSQVSPAMQVVIALMMYVAAYPFLLTVGKSSQSGPNQLERSRYDLTRGSSFIGSATVGRNSSNFDVAKATGVSTQHTAIKRNIGVSVASSSVEPSPNQHIHEKSAITPTLPRLQSYRAREIGGGMGDIPVAPTSVREQARGVASRDLLWLFLALVVICIAENARLRSDPFQHHMSIFGVLFEISSAYGTVGLSLGYPDQYTSLAAQLSTVSKLVLITAMVFGRHRGLPKSIDSAVYLPSILNTDEPAPDAVRNIFTIGKGGSLTRPPLPNFAAVRAMLTSSPAITQPRVEELVVDVSRFENGDEMAISSGTDFLRAISPGKIIFTGGAASPAYLSSALHSVPECPSPEPSDDIAHLASGDSAVADAQVP